MTGQGCQGCLPWHRMRRCRCACARCCAAGSSSTAGWWGREGLHQMVRRCGQGVRRVPAAATAATGQRPGAGPDQRRGLPPAAGRTARPGRLDTTRSATAMTGLLNLDPAVVATARRLAAAATEPVIALAHAHTTVAVERATLRLAGITGADVGFAAGDVPWVNRVVDTVREHCGLAHGAALPVFHALREHNLASLAELAEATLAGQVRYTVPTGRDAARAEKAARTAI